ncbi:MAG: hypothetical protein EU540_07610 [Promethearchaeota archaeon]|nr:MAG: hypothetical protein EU540_07610 [Candidatus Lokiarchaeota archaeon]
MKNSKDISSMNQEVLKSYLESNVIKSAIKLKGKFAPFSEPVDKIPKTLQIKRIYNLKEQLKNFFLIIVKNYSNSNQPKVRYFLTIILASQSSDFLVSLAKDYATRNNLKLIQYSLFPKKRISLLSLKEIRTIEDYSSSIELLKDFKKKFRKTLEKIRNLVENE